MNTKMKTDCSQYLIPNPPSPNTPKKADTPPQAREWPKNGWMPLPHLFTRPRPLGLGGVLDSAMAWVTLDAIVPFGCGAGFGACPLAHFCRVQQLIGPRAAGVRESVRARLTPATEHSDARTKNSCRNSTYSWICVIEDIDQS